MRTDPDQRNLWSSELSLVTVLDLLQIGIFNCKSQFDIVDYSLGIVHLRFFTLQQVVLLVFLGHHTLCYLLFQCA